MFTCTIILCCSLILSLSLGTTACNNTVSGTCAVLVGGDLNTVASQHASILGGKNNRATGIYSFIGGGASSNATGAQSVVCGGSYNSASGQQGFLGGGVRNVAGALYSSVVGGAYNKAQAIGGAVGGGYGNTISSGQYSTIPGGNRNGVAADFCFAAGSRAKCNHAGSFVWSDSSFAVDFPSSANYEFSIRATGGARIATAVDALGNPSAGVRLAAGSSSWTIISDKNMKKDVLPVDGREILEALVQKVPIKRWKYKAEVSGAEHMGPMAQDFYDAFQLGDSDKTISTVDADGVAMAAIHGLHAMIEEQRDVIEYQNSVIDGLRDLVEDLRSRVASLEKDRR